MDRIFLIRHTAGYRIVTQEKGRAQNKLPASKKFMITANIYSYTVISHVKNTSLSEVKETSKSF